MRGWGEDRAEESERDREASGKGMALRVNLTGHPRSSRPLTPGHEGTVWAVKAVMRGENVCLFPFVLGIIFFSFSFFCQSETLDVRGWDSICLLTVIG